MEILRIFNSPIESRVKYSKVLLLFFLLENLLHIY